MSHVILTVFLCVLCLIDASRAQFYCYVCQSPFDLQCNDVYNTSNGTNFDCSTLNYGTRSSDDSGPPLLDILREERIAPNTTYGCIKVHVTYTNSTAGIIRTCHPKVASIEDQCDFISKEQNVFTVNSCHYCETQRCNSASSYGISGLLAAIVLLVCFQD